MAQIGSRLMKTMKIVDDGMIRNWRIIYTVYTPQMRKISHNQKERRLRCRNPKSPRECSTKRQPGPFSIQSQTAHGHRFAEKKEEETPRGRQVDNQE